MKNLVIAVMTLGVFSLISACSTFDAYTGEKKASNTAKGAALGASLAALVAYVDNKDKDSKTRRDRILKAAGGGAAIGGGIGFYMDRQEAKLREKLRGSGVSIQRDGNNINLIMPGNITFPTNSSDINASFYEVLDSVAIVLEEYNKTMIVVAGYTDSKGSDAYNQSLSQRRAQSVASYLQNRKLLAERFEVIGFGEQKPIASNDTAEGRAENRRVEITLLPLENK